MGLKGGKMKQFLTLTLIAAFVFAGSAIASAQSSAIDINGIKIDVSAVIGFVGSHKSSAKQKSWSDNGKSINYDTKQIWIEDKNQAEYLADIKFTKTFANAGTAFLAIRGGANDQGSLAIGSFRGGVTDDNSTSSLGHDLVVVKEAWYSQSFFDKKLTGTLGKQGAPSSGNDASKSAGSFFTDDATVPGTAGADENPYGVVLAFDPISLLTVTYGFLTQEHQDSPIINGAPVSRDLSAQTYHVVVINLKPIEKGNYRVGYWKSLSGRDFTEVRDRSEGYDTGLKRESKYTVRGGQGEPQGIFLSLDQEVISNVSVFARAGYRLDETVGGGQGQAGQDVQFGVNVGGAFWGRANDSLFLGIGQAWYQKNIVGLDYLKLGDNAYDYYKYDSAQEEPETHFEINYRFALNDSITFIAFAQYVSGIYRYAGYSDQYGDYSNDHPNDPFGYDFFDASNGGYGYAGGLKLAISF
jgi:hypothetical protein